MDLIHTSLRVFDQQMGNKKYTCGDNIQIFDITLYNELSQVLFLYDTYMKTKP
jgi:glutathione S-transferase